MNPTLKRMILHVLRTLGFFWIARKLTARGVRILCYHGISLREEHKFHGKLFMQPRTFEGRLRLLQESGLHLVSLGEAVQALEQKRALTRAVVITFDDGWLGTYRYAVPALRRLGWPSTHYIATRYAVACVPVFDVTLRYLFWATRRDHIDLALVHSKLSGRFALPDDEQHALDTIEPVADTLSEDGQLLLLGSVAEVLRIDFAEIEQSGLFRLMTPDQLRELAQTGGDVQLHTHSHDLSVTEPARVEREISENRAALNSLTNSSLDHFCYPSGLFHPRIFPWLRNAGISSASTCLRGFNYPETDVFELKRFLDGEHISEIEFEAELSGALELLRLARARFVRRLRQRNLGA